MRFTKKRIIGGAATLVLVAGTAAAWWIAADARTPGQLAADSQPPPDSVITATAEDRELLELVELEGELKQADELKVEAPGGGGDSEDTDGNSGMSLVSKLPMKSGDKVTAGSVLIETTGRPDFARPGEVGADRDLTIGDEGPDVSQLQTALSGLYGTPVTGKFDERTAGDVAKLYQDAGYQPAYSSGTGGDEGGDAGSEEDGDAGDSDDSKGGGETLTVPASELYFAPELPVTVGKIKAKLGAPADGELLKLVSGKWQVVAEVDDKTASEVSKLKKNTPITFGEGPLEGKEAALPEIVEPKSDDEEAAEGEGDGYDEEEAPKKQVVFEVKDKVKADPGDYQAVTAEKLKSPDGSLVVPASAVWTSAKGDEKVTVAVDGETRDVQVTTEVDYHGEVAVTPVDGELADGDQVVVAKRDADNG
ncbi:MAG: peptidoglycan-binding domain-containing protein [Stackebrandtia sp.]